MSAFFLGIAQRPLDVRGFTARSPLFYRDVAMMFAVFSARLDRAAALVTAPEVVPLVVSRNTTLVAVQCFEYRHSDIGPYNEVSIAIAVRRRGDGPKRTVLRALALRQFSGFVVDLPVNTEVAVHGGVDFFGYPKWLASIDFSESGGQRRCRVRDQASGELVYAFTGDGLRTYTSGPIVRAPFSHSRETTLFRTYPVKDHQTLAATMLLNEKEKGMSLMRPSAFEVELGTHPRAQLLAQLGLERLLAYTYCPSSEAILFAASPLL